MENQNIESLEFIMDEPTKKMTFGTKMMVALCGFQSECPSIPKSKNGFGYKYAEFSKIVEIAKPHMIKWNIGFSQQMIGSDILRTIVFHSTSGEFISTDTKIPSGIELKGMNLFQTDGAKLTYYKKYQFCGILGIVTMDEDLDARGNVKTPANEKTIKKTLNEKQFISVLGAINSGQYTPEQIMEKFELSDEQKKSITSIQTS
jgi:hypothetical protein